MLRAAAATKSICSETNVAVAVAIIIAVAVVPCVALMHYIAPTIARHRHHLLNHIHPHHSRVRRVTITAGHLCMHRSTARLCVHRCLRPKLRVHCCLRLRLCTLRC